MMELASDSPVTPDPVSSEPAWPVLSAIEVRVLGCLLEKASTTPEYYPLTLNALTNACNQKSNRDPVMSLTEEQVLNALDGLRYTHQLAALVHTAGSRVDKYKHTLATRVPVTPEQAAILCELFLRGPETVGELRTRASRLCPLRDLDQVQELLTQLAGHPDGPLVVKLAKEPGRRESRWMHLLAGPPGDLAVAPVSAPEEATNALDALRDEVEGLKQEVATLRAEIADFRRQFE